MKLREKFKRFWTMDVHNHEGFTLVELIIVIAILAILSGVAVAGYSSYIKKANMQADKTLVAEIVNALSLAYYSGTISENGYVILSLNDSPEASSEQIEAAMAAAFGAGWNAEGNESLMLKYTEWSGDYGDSSFKGGEVVLLGQVEDLTEALAETLKKNNSILNEKNGLGFQDYMKNVLKFDEADLADEQKVADAAVLYVANGTKNVDKEAYEQVIIAAGEADGFLPVITGFKNVYGSNVMAAAATYALMVGFARAQGETNIPEMTAQDENFDATDIGNVLAVVTEPFVDLDCFNADDFEEKWAEYCQNQGIKDGAAFIDAMTTAYSAKDQIVGDLGKENCFGGNQDLAKLFAAYGDGHIVIMVEVKDGQAVIYPLPAMN